MAVPNAMASQFSRDGKYFAQLSTDGKLKIWETATSTFEQEFTPDYHLTAPCTCLQFIQRGSQANQNHSPRKKKRRDSLDLSAPYVALGTSSGLLLFYSISKNDVDFKLDSETNQSISSVSWNDGTVLYSAIDQNIVSWNLEKKTIKSKWKAGNEKLSAVLVLPDCTKILTASRNIKLWDVDRREVLRTFTGHGHDVSVLQYVSPRNNADAYIISGSKGDRLLSVWNLSDSSTEKNAVASFLMEDIPVNVSVLTAEGVSGLAVVTRSGVVHYYQHTLNGKCSKPLKPKTTIQVASDTSQSNNLVAPIPIIGAFLKDNVTITIGHGTETVLSFEHVVLNEYEKVQCLVRKDPRVAKESKETKVSKIRTPADNNVHYLTPHTAAGGTPKRKNDGTLEVPMEKRLENLTLNKLNSNSKVPKLDNVAQLLVQGLHSNDKKMLRTVLGRQDENVIKNTIKRLPMPVIVPLVQEVTNFVQGKTLASQTGALWLKHLMQIHAGLLLSNPELPELLGPVLGAIESRLSLLTPLNRLRGRLDLLVSQVSTVNSAKNAPENDDEAALLIYNDKELSDSESEDMDIAPQSESDNEWVEESSEDEDGVNEEDEDSDDDVEMS